MESCEGLRKRLGELATARAEELPVAVTRHLAECSACSALLARERLVQGLVRAATEGIEPPAGFAEKVLASLQPALERSPAEADLWRPAWGLVPAFAATAAALLLLFQTSADTDTTSLLPTGALSVGESLLLESPTPGLDLILTAVLDRGEP